jgi:hypothetical protein
MKGGYEMSHKNKEMQILNLLRSIIISTIRLVPAWLPLSILILGFPPVTVAQLPCYDIHVTGDDIYCSNWLPNAVITLSIQPDGFYASTNTNSEGFAIFADIYDIQGGQTITISDGNTTIPYVVTNVLVDSVDTCNDTVSGTAAPDSIVYIEPWLDNRVPRMATVTDSTGHWIVDYGKVGTSVKK